MNLPSQLKVKRQVRQFEVRDFTVTESDSSTSSGPGRIRFIANVMGDMDTWSTVIDPDSCTTAMLDVWRVQGCVLGAHDACETPIAMVMENSIDGRSIVAEAQYHSTERGIEYYTIALERQANGKVIGFSLGFDVAEYEYFQTGKKMIEALRARGRDMSKFNVPQIEAHEGECWLMLLEQIYEASQCNFASNLGSKALEVRETGRVETVPVPTETEEEANARIMRVESLMSNFEERINRRRW